mmetsp:Transcript_25421/g.38550  ORF Transcript_25421/g.38550 Transcript_25421/m.38550 type:complete len:168 (+) Transcript_25421:1986-2489(+)
MLANNNPITVLQVMQNNMWDAAVALMTKQMTAKKGLKVREHRRAALRYLMFLKQKRCGQVKGRGCADGSKQRIYKTKEETSSPTIHIESLFLTSIIDALEGREVVTLDKPGAFMQVEIDELIHVKLEGKLADLLIKVDPSYCSTINLLHTKEGRKLYMLSLTRHCME